MLKFKWFTLTNHTISNISRYKETLVRSHACNEYVILSVQSRVLEAAGSVYVVKRNKSGNATVSNYRRGTGGRSSFSGIVATVFGGKSCLGNMVINRLGKKLHTCIV